MEHRSNGQEDSSLALGRICGTGEKAFCAGGDVVSLYNHMVEANSRETGIIAPDYAAFFTQEYRLNLMMHNYPKPIICWGKGIIMGGGLGLFAASRYRVACDNARIAMPEVSIGLFPDVGASYFLNKMPEGLGLFLGLTGAQFGAKDAHACGLASHILDANSLDILVEKLASEEHISEAKIESVLAELEVEASGPAQISGISALLVQLSQSGSVQDADQILNESRIKYQNEAWLSKALDNYLAGSALSKALTWEQLKRGKNLSLQECFEQELNLALNSALHGDFCEGVRALLVDKDRTPRWRFSEVAQVPSSLLTSCFDFPETCLVNGSHPLTSK